MGDFEYISARNRVGGQRAGKPSSRIRSVIIWEASQLMICISLPEKLTSNRIYCVPLNFHLHPWYYGIYQALGLAMCVRETLLCSTFYLAPLASFCGVLRPWRGVQGLDRKLLPQTASDIANSIPSCFALSSKSVSTACSRHQTWSNHHLELYPHINANNSINKSPESVRLASHPLIPQAGRF